MGVKTVSTMAESRALLTERERELLASDAEDEEQYRYQAASRIRRRINDELAADVAVMAEHHPQLLGEFREVACADDPLDADTGEEGDE